MSHLTRLKMLGVKYLIIVSEHSKTLLSGAPGIRRVADFGDWSILELSEEPKVVEIPKWRPDLVFGAVDFKRRYRTEQDFVALAEQQFFTNSLDVILVRAPAGDLESLAADPNLFDFGSLIVMDYRCSECDAAFVILHAFAQKRPLLLLSDGSQLFFRLRSALSDLPQAKIIYRSQRLPREAIGANFGPTESYAHSENRSLWLEIKSILDETKEPLSEPRLAIGQEVLNPNLVHFSLVNGRGERIPVLIKQTFNPNWKCEGCTGVYAATAMLTLAFSEKSFNLRYARGLAGDCGIAVSFATMLLLILWWGRSIFRDLHRSRESF